MRTGKGVVSVVRARKRYNNIDHVHKKNISVPSFKQYQDY